MICLQNDKGTEKLGNFALFAIHLDQDTLDQLSNSTSGPGYWTQVKIPTTITHQPFSIALGHQELEEQAQRQMDNLNAFFHLMLSVGMAPTEGPPHARYSVLSGVHGCMHVRTHMYTCV